MWLEDPVPPENVQALRARHDVDDDADRHGKNGYMRHGFREAFECGAIDIAAPDPQKTGGLLETRRIADYADTHYISVAPHCIASPIGTVAKVHVAAAVPNFLALEWHGMSVPFWNDLAAGRDGKVIEGGRIKVPDSPGLGVTLNLESRARTRARASRSSTNRRPAPALGKGPIACSAVGRIVSSGT